MIRTTGAISPSAPARSAVITAAFAAFCRSDGHSAALCAEQESLLDELLADDPRAAKRRGTLRMAPMLAIVMPAARRLSVAGWPAGPRMPSRDALVRIWQEWRWRGKMPALFTLGRV
ncbi:hypothetical protein ACNKHW_01280 [Shigella flexneri]